MARGRPTDPERSAALIEHLTICSLSAYAGYDGDLYVPPGVVPAFLRASALRLIEECRSERFAATLLALREQPDGLQLLVRLQILSHENKIRSFSSENALRVLLFEPGVDRGRAEERVRQISARANELRQGLKEVIRDPTTPLRRMRVAIAAELPSRPCQLCGSVDAGVLVEHQKPKPTWSGSFKIGGRLCANCLLSRACNPATWPANSVPCGKPRMKSRGKSTRRATGTNST